MEGGDYTFLAFNFEIPHFTSIPLFRSHATLTVKMSWLRRQSGLRSRPAELYSISMPPLLQTQTHSLTELLDGR